MNNKNFSHVANFTGYMEIVFNIVLENSKKQLILDMPAGNGILAQRLELAGNKVICADINNEKDSYIYTDMEDTLPFQDEEFDTIICLEGIEHVINPSNLISELCRVCKKNGRIIISLPNIQNCYSRLHFLFTGFFYQFSPQGNRHINKSDKIDRGHISSLSYVQLRYLFNNFGAETIKIKGDRYKKKILVPLYLFIITIGYVFYLFNTSRKDDIEMKEITKDIFSKHLLLSRSLILVFEKRNIVKPLAKEQPR